jgi:hypothetical protein
MCFLWATNWILIYIIWKKFSHDSQSRERVKYGHESRVTRNQEWLCWWGPTAIYLTWSDLITLLNVKGTTHNGNIRTRLMSNFWVWRGNPRFFKHVRVVSCLSYNYADRLDIMIHAGLVRPGTARPAASRTTPPSVIPIAICIIKYCKRHAERPVSLPAYD